MSTCDFPRCRNWSDVGYIGTELCWDHWTQLCEADSKTEKRLLKKVGLVRDKTGSVVPISTDKKTKDGVGG